MSRVTILGLLLGVAAYLALSGLARALDDVSADEYGVYSAVIDQHWIVHRQSIRSRPVTGPIVISDQTSARSLSEIPDEQLDTAVQVFGDAARGVLGALKRGKQQPASLDRQFHLQADYTLLSRRTILEVIGEDGSGWDRFHELYPDSGGIVTFSRVTFDPDWRRALVVSSLNCHSLCGVTHLIFLSRNDTSWTVVNYIPVGAT